MKKITFIILATFLALSTSAGAACQSDPVELQSTILDPTSQHDGQHKGIVQTPEVSIEGHTLYFGTPCDGCLLNIVDGNSTVVYTLMIPSGTTSLVIPATLSGGFKLQIIDGNYLFYGIIFLP